MSFKKQVEQKPEAETFNTELARASYYVIRSRGVKVVASETHCVKHNAIDSVARIS